MRDQKTCKMENTLTFQNSVLFLYTLCRPLVDVYSCEPFNNIVNIHILTVGTPSLLKRTCCGILKKIICSYMHCSDDRIYRKCRRSCGLSLPLVQLLRFGPEAYHGTHLGAVPANQWDQYSQWLQCILLNCIFFLP